MILPVFEYLLLIEQKLFKELVNEERNLKGPVDM